MDPSRPRHAVWPLAGIIHCMMNSMSGPRIDPDTLEAWCRQAADGDLPALERLLTVHHGSLAALARRKIGVDWQGKIDPDDVLQEAYIAVFAGICEFAYRGEDSFYHWARSIVDHKFVDQVRRCRRKRRDVAREVARDGRSPSRHESFLERCLPNTQTPSAVLRRDEAVGALMSCIARLPDDYRLVVQRLHLNNEPLALLAADLDRSEDAVRRLASRAVARLKTCLGRASRYLSSRG